MSTTYHRRSRTMEERIAKLLAKAEGTDNPHEAEAFMAKAEELMLRFGIDRAKLEASRPGAKQQEIIITKVRIPNGHGYAAAMAAIGHAVGPSFSLRTLQSNLSDGAKVLWLIGHSSDVQDAETLLNSLLVQSRTQALHWWKTEGKTYWANDNDAYLARREFIFAFASGAYWANDNDAYLARREFIFAFASGVRSRLLETRNRVVEESGAGTELVLADRSKLVDNWVGENLKVGKGRASNRRAGSYAAVEAGHAAGRDSVSSKALK